MRTARGSNPRGSRRLVIFALQLLGGFVHVASAHNYDPSYGDTTAMGEHGAPAGGYGAGTTEQVQVIVSTVHVVQTVPVTMTEHVTRHVTETVQQHVTMHVTVG